MGGSLAQMTLPAAFSGATYNAANQLVQRGGANFSYDPVGNLTSDGTSTYTWNARNQLASISGSAVTAAFSYDASGQRIATQINTVQQQFQFDGANVVQEFNGLGTVTANLLTGLGLDENYSRTDMSGTHSFLTDALNSTVAVSDASGNSSSQYTYDPFGNTTQTGAASSNAFQFTGRQNDGTGLYYMRARYYSPALGRFISADPIGALGGINLYAYADGNPIGLTDPMGMDPSGGGPGALPYIVGGAVFVGVAAGVAFLGPELLGLELVSLGVDAALPELGAEVAGEGIEVAETAPVVLNIAGEGEIPGAINVQYPGALDSAWGSAGTTGPPGQTLAELASNGDAYVVADNAALPFADGSVNAVYTNSVPLDTVNWLGEAFPQSSEITRILGAGGQWFNNGNLWFQVLP